MKQRGIRYRLFYDEDDYHLLEIVNKIISRGKNPTLLRKLFDPALHPSGIKELAAPRSLRIASAMIDLLGTFEQGSPNERLTALRAVRAEALHDRSRTLRLNVARVLLQIMKEIVRAHGDDERQLALAHDFRKASSCKPRLIRRQLRKYHLLEMPESWNQLAFDHHVHDANTKGRKSPTHLIMDAWIKGIRFLGVVYYNFVKPEVAAELLEAADIMGIDVRIGIEISAQLRDRAVQLIWAPRGFHGRMDFLRFLGDPEVKGFLAAGQAVVEHEKSRVLEQLRSFNQNHLSSLNEQHGISVPALGVEDFLASVGSGQASLVHLAEFIHLTIVPHLRRRVEALSEQYEQATGAEQERIRELVLSFNEIDPESIVDLYLRPAASSGAPGVATEVNCSDVPEMPRLSPSALLDRLECLPCRSRITLNPSNLAPADVLEVLYEGQGRITHLEIYNVKDWSQNRTTHRAAINEIRLVINSGNVVEAKRLVRGILMSMEGDPQQADKAAAVEKIRTILWDLKTLLGFYGSSRLRSRLGSDSIGHSRHTRGMGLVVVPTLPWRARREVGRDPDRRIPVATVARRHTMSIHLGGSTSAWCTAHRQENTAGTHREESQSRDVTWSVGHNSTTLATVGNIATLGGRPRRSDNGLRISRAGQGALDNGPSRRHLNSGVINFAKVLIGFLPAFLTFFLTKDWWLLAYFGAVIWFGITGLRNILQSVVGGGGLRRSSLLNWRDLVSWGRVADSLMFTGFSVPLLDLVVKDLLLARGLNVTTATNPLVLYSVMALVNGIYISSHNTFRGLPLTAIVGNFFRTILSIPVALALYYLIFRFLLACGVPAVVALAGLQLWAAVISKAASDLVAALIEGAADRQQSLAQRTTDYREKLAQVYDVYGRLETTFPEQDVLTLLESPKELALTLGHKSSELLRYMVINSLDLLYLWMYQPRAQTALAQQIGRMSADEKRFLLQSQQVLHRKRIVSEMMLDGLVGKVFERALAFYLSHSDRYLRSFAELTDRH